MGEYLKCGHHASLSIVSVESGAFLYCDLCDAKSGRSDAEQMEQELRAEVAALKQERAAWNRRAAPTAATEGPTRDNASYAVEHAQYMATGADRLVSAIQGYTEMVVRREERDDVDEDAVHDATCDLGESAKHLRGLVYEFRKRADRYLAGRAAPTPPQQPLQVEPSMQRAEQWGRLYDRASRLMAVLGRDGEVSTRTDEVALLMDALHEIDGGQHIPGLMPTAQPALPVEMTDTQLNAYWFVCSNANEHILTQARRFARAIEAAALASPPPADASAVPAVRVPDEYALVPIEPTEAMVDAACDIDARTEVIARNKELYPQAESGASAGEVFRVQWREALAAAPAQPVLTERVPLSEERIAGNAVLVPATQLRELQEDARRLDFIESQGCHGLVADDNGMWALSDAGTHPIGNEDRHDEPIFVGTYVEPAIWRPSVRDAIDLARAAVAATQEKKHG